MPFPTDKQASERQKKLDRIRELIAAGTLTVRQMTPAERAQHRSRIERPDAPPRRRQRPR